MADAGVDLAQLTDEQQLALQQFTAVTDQELKDAVPLLQRCQWNVQVCAGRSNLSESPILTAHRLR
jgi:FAS-associated factor 2